MQEIASETKKKRALIVGMRFGGVRAAEGLVGRGFDVLCIDPRKPMTKT